MPICCLENFSQPTTVNTEEIELVIDPQMFQTDEKESITSDLILNNHPNPFNSSTAISFNLNSTDSQIAKLEIFNLKGQKVRQYSIFNDQSSISWDGTDESGKHVANGIYYYHLQTDGFSKTKKMILMK